MKIKIVSLFAVTSMLLLSSGCVAMNSGNVASHTQPPVYEKGELAVVTTTTEITDSKGLVSKIVKTTTKTGLAVADETINHKLDVADHVGVAQAGGGTSLKNFWTSSPTNTAYVSNGNGGGYYTGGNSGFYTNNGGYENLGYGQRQPMVQAWNPYPRSY
jgi:hypothetical protein